MQSNDLTRLSFPAIAAVCLLAGCVDPRLPPRPVGKTPGAPPAPPAAPVPPGSSGAGVVSAPATESAAPDASGLPADLVAKIDVLIQSHKDYIAAAEKVQDPQTAKEQVEAFRARSVQNSAAYEDVMIAYGKLPQSQKAAFESYMNAQVLELNNQRRAQLERLEELLRQAP